jgi:hypothetical protein
VKFLLDTGIRDFPLNAILVFPPGVRDVESRQ